MLILHGIDTCMTTIEVVVLHQRMWVESLVVDKRSAVPPASLDSAVVDSSWRSNGTNVLCIVKQRSTIAGCLRIRRFVVVLLCVVWMSRRE